jgi:hypothetical protein
MALRFRCEHCGKRLQVDQQPNSKVMCPYCRNVVTVPADAQAYDPAAAKAAAPQPAGAPQQGQEQEPQQEGTSDAVVAFMATYLPTWGTSVVLHMAVVLLALMSSWWAVQPKVEKVEYQAEARTMEQKKFIREVKDKPLDSGQKARTTRRAMSNTSSSFVFKVTNNPVPDVASGNLQPIEVIGVGGGGTELGGMAGFGTGRGGGSGGGGAEFFGVGGVARKVVYVVDHSGSMTDSIMYVKFELKRSIRMLKPNQQFHVIFYSSGPALEMPSRKLMPATEGNKLAANEFIDSIVPVGQTDPSEALSRAFQQDPELIYLLTDGDFDKKIIDHIDKLNTAKKVTIHTIGFIYSIGEPILQEIAKRNAGSYRFVGENDLSELKQ